MPAKEKTLDDLFPPDSFDRLLAEIRAEAAAIRAARETADCDRCGRPTFEPAVEITYKVGDEIHEGCVTYCEACQERGAQEILDMARAEGWGG